jgi:DNA-binding LytR/AlgR family response regulator
MSALTALLADDEPLLRERLRSLLMELWPELTVIAEARNGVEASELCLKHQPAFVFLDIQMPGQSGLQAAHAIRSLNNGDSRAKRTHLVFVTAYEQYAVKAFEAGAIDYVLKPYDHARLAETVTRLKERLNTAASEPPGLQTLLEHLQQKLAPRTAHLQWIKASVGQSVKLIAVEQIFYFRSDEKYTTVAWEGGQALIRKSIKELIDELDPQMFAQVHRSSLVNLHKVNKLTRGTKDSAELHLNGCNDVLTVSRSFVHLFKQM